MNLRSEQIVARIEPDLLDRLRGIAEREDRSVSYIVRMLLHDALEAPRYDEAKSQEPAEAIRTHLDT